MKRIVALATAILASLTLTATSLGRTTHRHRTRTADSSVQPDQVIQWNQEMLQWLQVPGAQPSTIHPTRTMAITELSVYDAVNAIEGGSEPYLFRRRGPRGASAAAAAASAARTALRALLPSQQPAIDAKFQASLSQIGSGRRVEQGIRVGEEAAQTILASRAGDGAAVTPPSFIPGSGPGEYQLTPPAFQQPAFTQFSNVKPFALLSGDQFRPPPPPAVSSARYADDFNEVKSLGRSTSTTRSAEQTAIGRFWGAAPVQNVWNQIAQMAGTAFHNTLGQNARMFALVDTTLADGVVALYDAKYAYHRWRPVTAIQAADTGNPGAVSDPAWIPLAPTAPDPSYPGAHAEISASAATALREFFGTDRLDFTLSNANVPGVVRSFASFSQAAGEASASRIFAGQHFRYDEHAGQALGGHVGDFVFDHVLSAER
jgi:PAP2 superfamily protein